MSLLMEFAVQMKCQSCADKIESNLKNIEGIVDVEVHLDSETVLVESSLPSSVIKEKLEEAGNVVVLKGYGSKDSKGNICLKENGSKDDNRMLKNVNEPNTSAVAMLGGVIGYSGSLVQGVVRFVQASDDVCIVDGTIDGLSPGLHGLHIHECGDISKGCDSVGDHFDLSGAKHGGPCENAKNRHTGDLGNVKADEGGRATFRLEDTFVKVWDIIGRSIVVTESQDDLGKGGHALSEINGNSGNRLACGIISRSSGIFENTKKICACDGVTLWDERNKPVAGPGRRNASNDNEATSQKTCSAS